MYVFTVTATDEIVGPQNIAVISGSTATFSCIIHVPHSEVFWNHETISPKHYNRLYKQGKLTSVCNYNRCNVTHNNETDRYTLTINSVQHYDAGIYECIEFPGFGHQAAELIVLEPVDITEGIIYAKRTSKCTETMCHDIFVNGCCIRLITGPGIIMFSGLSFACPSVHPFVCQQIVNTVF